MSWGIAEGWLSVVGTLLLTLGTGAQAWANRADYKSLQQTASEVAIGAMMDALDVEGRRLRAELLGRLAGDLAGGGSDSRRTRFWLRWHLPSWLFLLKAVLFTIVVMPGKFSQIRTKGGDEAVQLARSLRAAEVWAIIMVGSALALMAAVIQLVLAYQ